MAEKCDPDVYSKGLSLCLLSGPKSETVEAWVQKLRGIVRERHDSAAELDWHVFAGWDVVKCISSIDGVIGACRVIEEILPELRAAYVEEKKGYQPYEGYVPEVAFRWTEDTRAIMQPDLQHQIEVEREERHARYEDETQRRLAETEYLVEADSFAQQALWERWHDRLGVPWEQRNPGWMPTIGFHGQGRAKRPVVVNVFWNLVGGQLVGFWEITSQLADYKMAEEWLDKTFPKAKHRANAENFHNIIHAIQDATGQKLITRSTERCPKCKRGGY